MWMTDYIREIQRRFVTEYGMPEDPQNPGVPIQVPDGNYPMVIDGKLDRVKVVDGRIRCGNFDHVGTGP